jgi:hypothetical protein
LAPPLAVAVSATRLLSTIAPACLTELDADRINNDQSVAGFVGINPDGYGHI